MVEQSVPSPLYLRRHLHLYLIIVMDELFLLMSKPQLWFVTADFCTVPHPESCCLGQRALRARCRASRIAEFTFETFRVLIMSLFVALECT